MRNSPGKCLLGSTLLLLYSQEFPPVSSGGKKSSITAAHIESQLEDVTIEMVQYNIFLCIINQSKFHLLDESNMHP